MEVAGSVATIIQLVSFTGEVLVAGYGFLSKLQKAPTELRSLLNETASLNFVLDQLQTVATESNIAHTMTALETLDLLGIFRDCKALMNIILESIKQCEQRSGQDIKNLGRRILWPFKEKETKETLQQLGRLRETLSAAMIVDSAKTLHNLTDLAKLIDMKIIDTLNKATQIQNTAQETAEDLSQLKVAFANKVNMDESMSIRSWLYPDGIDINTSFEAALKLRHPTTGFWFLGCDAFKDWLSGDRGCMWIYGIPGCGKTILSATVIEHLQNDLQRKESAILYFFCNHRDPRKRNLLDFLHVLAKKLLEENEGCFDKAKTWYHKKLNKALSRQESPATLSKPEYIGLIKDLCSVFSPVYIVVDALDECNDLTEFSSSLLGLIEDKSCIKLFVTSRNDVALQRIMEPVASHQLALKDHMGIDIRSYLATEIPKRIASGTLKLRHTELISIIATALEEKADGMILIAKLQLDYLCGLKSDRSIKESLYKLPAGINATYDEIIQQIYDRSPEDVNEIKFILQWLVCSIVPLTLDQLAEAVSIRPGDRRLEREGIATDPKNLAASCRSLVTLQAQDTGHQLQEDLRGNQITLIRPSHASVEEYLTLPRMQSGPLSCFYLDLQSAHRQLAETCLQYIGFEDFNSIQRMPSNTKEFVGCPHWYLSRKVLMERTFQYALYEYACTYWATHLSVSGASADPKITGLLEWFLKPDQHPEQYISWQQMYHHDIQYYCSGRPPLHYAIEFGIDFLVNFLLPEKDQVDVLYRGMAALHVAAKCGSLNVCMSLLRQGATIDLKSGSEANAMTALNFAAEGGHVDIMEVLLAAGASPNSQGRSGANPIYRAARGGSLEALKVLYNAGNDINARTWDNWTPLFEAVARGKSNVAEQLLEWGADPMISIDGGENALTLITAAKHKNDIDLDKILTGDPLWWKSPERNSLGALQQMLAETHREICVLQAQAAANGREETFKNYLAGMEPTYYRLVKFETDTRPGIERDKSVRWNEDVRSPSWLHVRESRLTNIRGQYL